MCETFPKSIINTYKNNAVERIKKALFQYRIHKLSYFHELCHVLITFQFLELGIGSPIVWEYCTFLRSDQDGSYRHNRQGDCMNGYFKSLSVFMIQSHWIWKLPITNNLLFQDFCRQLPILTFRWSLTEYIKNLTLWLRTKKYTYLTFSSFSNTMNK